MSLLEPGTSSPLAKIEQRKRPGADHLGVAAALMPEAGKIAPHAQSMGDGVVPVRSSSTIAFTKTAHTGGFSALTFFTDSDYYTGPAFSSDALVNAESVLRVRLPSAYSELLRERNGGCPRRACIAFSGATGWAPDHIRIQAILGIGGRWGIEDNASMIAEWGYPPIGVVICLTPSGGHDTVMLDYRGCGPQGEPAVAYIDDDRAVLNVAESFSQFLDKLVDCSVFSPP